MNVYVVRSARGEYEDRIEFVCGVFTDKGVAEALCEENNRPYTPSSGDAKATRVVSKIDASTIELRWTGYSGKFSSEIPTGPVASAEKFWVTEIPLDEWGEYS